uniref:Uncharacterized protein n=1 Tax=Marseillevirus LCMAC101 TaxID=2506602 RepID=A0A481YT85_9VIRU|nr:MAG: hypothetical protein LCMAC101_07520 [Marseillevirus LCMAC101]
MYGLVILVVFLVIFFICYFNSRVDGYEEGDQNDQVRCVCIPDEKPCNIFERAKREGYISNRDYLFIMKQYGGGHPCTCKTPLCNQLAIAIYNGFIDPYTVNLLLGQYEYYCPNLDWWNT